jgi:hypothetical protein
LMQLCYPDPVHAIQGEDFMAGTSPRSFEWIGEWPTGGNATQRRIGHPCPDRIHAVQGEDVMAEDRGIVCFTFGWCPRTTLLEVHVNIYFSSILLFHENGGSRPWRGTIRVWSSELNGFCATDRPFLLRLSRRGAIRFDRVRCMVRVRQIDDFFDKVFRAQRLGTVYCFVTGDRQHDVRGLIQGFAHAFPILDETQVFQWTSNSEPTQQHEILKERVCCDTVPESVDYR